MKKYLIAASICALMGVLFIPALAMADYHPHLDGKNISEGRMCVSCHNESPSSGFGLDYNPLYSHKQLMVESEQLKREASYQEKMLMFIFAWIAGSIILVVVLSLRSKNQSDPEAEYKGTGYKILTSNYDYDLQKTVNEFLKRGWCLSGSVSVTSDFFGRREYTQAVFKDEPVPVEGDHVDQEEARR